MRRILIVFLSTFFLLGCQSDAIKVDSSASIPDNIGEDFYFLIVDFIKMSDECYNKKSACEKNLDLIVGNSDLLPVSTLTELFITENFLEMMQHMNDYTYSLNKQEEKDSKEQFRSMRNDLLVKLGIK